MTTATRRAPVRAEWLDPPDFGAAKAAQVALAARVVQTDAPGPVRLIAGVDVSTTRFDPERWVHAAVVVLAWPGLTPVATATASLRARLPYVPGYLGFREIPALREAWAGLPVTPDLVLVDGHGIAHPRGFGIASHLGVVLGVRTIGVAKSVLVGTPAEPLAEAPGATSALLHRGERIATLLRSRARAHPLVVSIGHGVSEETALHWVRATLGRHRLPEPTRLAHLAAGEARRAALAR